MPDSQMSPYDQLWTAVFRGQLDKVKDLCLRYPELKTEGDNREEDPTLVLAALKESSAVLDYLLEAGFNVNVRRLPDNTTPVTSAIGFDRDANVELILKYNPDLSIGRPIISALNSRKEPSRRLKYVKWLVEAGADVNQLHDLYGDPDKQFTALDWTADPAVIEYLRSKGAKTAAELHASSKAPAMQTAREVSPEAQTIGYFNTHFGQTLGQPLIEVEPGSPAIAVRVIPVADDRKHVTLYTTGLSHHPMPPYKGSDDYRYAELFIELPGDWKYASDDPRSAWPVYWMRKIAKYPIKKNVPLGGALTIVANGDPPKPLGPGTRFTCILLLAEKQFDRDDGVTIQLYRMVPLYTEERELERKQGAPALMRAFDRAGVSFIVDVARSSVVKS